MSIQLTKEEKKIYKQVVSEKIAENPNTGRLRIVRELRTQHNIKRHSMAEMARFVSSMLKKCRAGAKAAKTITTEEIVGQKELDAQGKEVYPACDRTDCQYYKLGKISCFRDKCKECLENCQASGEDGFDHFESV